MSDFLQQMAASSRARCDAARAQVSLATLTDRAEHSPPPCQPDWHPDFALIAEIKARSPALGRLADSDTIDRARLGQSYVDAGASAVSVLTEPDKFDGQLAHLAEVSVALSGSAPAMRKDFLVDPYQVIEARVCGAGGVLLIAAMLDDQTLLEMLLCAQRFGLFVLLECFDRDDLERCHRLLSRDAANSMAANAQLLIGINTRNLRTLDVDATRLETLAAHLPKSVRCVAESGLVVPEDAARVVAMGYDVALIGTALMRSEDPGATVRAFIAAGRD
ncbi:MAG: indole-3-glycerol phosphate synthase TrpC [Pseudomonadota bacterium]